MRLALSTSMEGSASEEFMAELEKTVVEMNNQYEEDKDYQRMLRGTAVTYPGDIILFGRENPDIVPSVWQNEDGVFIAEAEGQFHVESPGTKEES